MSDKELKKERSLKSSYIGLPKLRQATAHAQLTRISLTSIQPTRACAFTVRSGAETFYTSTVEYEQLPDLYPDMDKE
jgi:hypothetical protein